MLVNVADPKLASVGWGGLTAVGSSSIHSAESPGPLYVDCGDHDWPVLWSSDHEVPGAGAPLWVMEADIWSPGETSPRFTGGAG